MKSFLVICASSVLAGLSTYGVLEATNAIGLFGNTGYLTMRIGDFVATLAAIGFLSAMLALLFRYSLAREQSKTVGRLEARLAELEQRAEARATATPASAPASARPEPRPTPSLEIS